MNTAVKTDEAWRIGAFWKIIGLRLIESVTGIVESWDVGEGINMLVVFFGSSWLGVLQQASLFHSSWTAEKIEMSTIILLCKTRLDISSWLHFHSKFFNYLLGWGEKSKSWLFISFTLIWFGDGHLYWTRGTRGRQGWAGALAPHSVHIYYFSAVVGTRLLSETITVILISVDDLLAMPNNRLTPPGQLLV